MTKFASGHTPHSTVLRRDNRIREGAHFVVLSPDHRPKYSVDDLVLTCDHRPQSSIYFTVLTCDHSQKDSAIISYWLAATDHWPLFPSLYWPVTTVRRTVLFPLLDLRPQTTGHCILHCIDLRLHSEGQCYFLFLTETEELNMYRVFLSKLWFSLNRTIWY